jgi:hypothetical protein
VWEFTPHAFGFDGKSGNGTYEFFWYECFEGPFAFHEFEVCGVEDIFLDEVVLSCFFEEFFHIWKVIDLVLKGRDECDLSAASVCSFLGHDDGVIPKEYGFDFSERRNFLEALAKGGVGRIHFGFGL